jgi:hypothetical protein
MPHSRRPAGSTAPFAAALGIALWSLSGPVSLEGQAHPSATAPEEIRQIQTISPRSGPPGTMVSVSTLNLPYEARIHVGVGAMGQGFEALAEAEQGRLGEIATRVQVPANAPLDRPIVFIAFNAIFAPIGMSDPFHVTDPEGRVQRTGEVVSRDPGCIVFRDRDGYEYELTEGTENLPTEGKVHVEGVFFDGGVCTDGPSIGVAEFRPGN